MSASPTVCETWREIPFNQFLVIVSIREREEYGNEHLSDEWAEAKVDSGFLAANAVDGPSITDSSNEHNNGVVE